MAKTPAIESKPGQPNDASSMIPILTGQRDRYRQRNQTLEEVRKETFFSTELNEVTLWLFKT